MKKMKLYNEDLKMVAKDEKGDIISCFYHFGGYAEKMAEIFKGNAFIEMSKEEYEKIINNLAYGN